MRHTLVALFLLALSVSAHAQAQDGHFLVTAAPSLPSPVSGRLLLFMKQGSGDTIIDYDIHRPEAVWIAAQEIHDLPPGASVEIDANIDAYPQPFRNAPPGTWEVQAVLDVDHKYTYDYRNERDWESPVVALGKGQTSLMLSHHAEPSARRKTWLTAAPVPGKVELFELESPSLSRFWGRPTMVRGWVVLPPGYNPQEAKRYPTVWWNHGYSVDFQYALYQGLRLQARMEDHRMPPMIWVMLDERGPGGTHEYADSVNNGPLGTALTTEYLPAIEREYRMDGQRNGRLLTGQSAGAWASLHLLTGYPQLFGGAWMTALGQMDFHDWNGTDLYAPGANLYRKPDGSPKAMLREGDKIVATMEQVIRLEEVLEPHKGHIGGEEWVNSPRAEDGSPQQLFDRTTGQIHPEVARYMRDRYDIAYRLEQTWPANGALLKGCFHVIVGTADTYFLERGVRRFEAKLQSLGADPKFTYLPGREHFDLYRVGDDPDGLYDRLAAEMWAVARPGVASR